MFVRIKKHRRGILLGSCLLALSIIVIPNLAGLIITTFYGAPVGDDYSAIKEFSMTDDWIAAALHSLANTGRYTQSITSSIAYGAMGDRAPVLLPAITIIWLMLLIYAYTYLILKRVAPKDHALISALITVLITSLIASVNRPLVGDGTWFAYQMLFFSSAIVTYSIPLLVVLSACYIAALRKKYNWASLLIFGIIIYIIGLSNETLPATIIAITPIIIITYFAYSGRLTIKNKLSAYSMTGALASLFALLTLYFSPSSTKRRQSSGMTEDTNVVGSVIERVGQMIDGHLFRLSDIVLMLAISLIIAALITAYSGKMIDHKTTRRATTAGLGLLVSSLMALTVASTLLVVGYGPLSPVYPRTLMIYQILYVSGLLLLGVGAGLYLLRIKKFSGHIKITAMVLALIAIVLVTPGQLTRATSQITASVQYASAWRELDHQLRNSREQVEIIEVDQDATGIGDGFSLVCYGDNFEEQNWLNVVIQDYYGTSRICSNSTPVEWPY